MFGHMMMPLHEQYDYGFHGMGDAYMAAAKHLEEKLPVKGIGEMNLHLPAYFLYRHAIELFLKSVILILHRRLGLPDEKGVHEPIPKIQSNGKKCKLDSTHNLVDLYEHYKKMTMENAAAIKGMTRRGDWSQLYPEVDEWIAAVHAADEKSMFLRYPTSNSAGDKTKSGFKEMTPDDLIHDMNPLADPGTKSKVVMFMKDDDNRIVKGYTEVVDPLPELRENLLKAARMLSGMSFGMLSELPIFSE